MPSCLLRSHSILSENCLSRCFQRHFQRAVGSRCQPRTAIRTHSNGLAAAEVEVKLRLLGPEAHDALAAALQPHYRETHEQENTFFDGAKRELSSQRTVVRCRFYNVDKRALLTIKGQQVLVDGIGRGSEVEEDVDPIYARTFLEHPDNLFKLDSDMLQTVLRKHNVSQLVCLGGFRNTRRDYSWEGHKLELDTTCFDWGTVHEVEVESEEPEVIKSKLEKFLQQRHIDFRHSSSSKFANFINRTLV